MEGSFTLKEKGRHQNSHVSFDKRFSIGQHLNESNLAAKMTKDGKLVVTAPKVGSGEKDEVRTQAEKENMWNRRADRVAINREN